MKRSTQPSALSARPKKNCRQRAGVCRFCKCTQERACFPTCVWIDEARTVCDSPACVLHLAARLMVALRPAGWRETEQALDDLARKIKHAQLTAAEMAGAA